MTVARRLSTRALVAVMVVTPVLFLGAMPWLKHAPEAVVMTLAGIAALIVIGGGWVLNARCERRQDEVQRAGSRFASYWGHAIGGGLVVLAVLAPPVQDALMGIAGRLASPGAVIEEDPVILLFLGGVMATVLTQALCTAGLFAVWKQRMAS